MALRNFDTPFGPMLAEERQGRLTQLAWTGDLADAPDGRDDTPLLRMLEERVVAYLTGARVGFQDLAVETGGTDFQRRCWEAIRAIPYGQAWSYGDVARHLGSGARAVGTACALNHLALVVPCHRVIAAGGRIGGYGGAESLKRRLLALEGIVLRAS
ncbi:methylated-DNA--[protein]-cysteine S-methyltransferase [Zavarzinia sp. CC-PAN008]|uniref:methylated-DNA--[protein]-cysteine S-methyltransferase n=1 Tax=Zavarzinia sp. CC-PAN008 TaxID=3243332 RepID=UPI003F747D92